MNLLRNFCNKMLAVAACLAVLLALCSAAGYAAVGGSGNQQYMADQIMVKFRTAPTATDLNDVMAAAGAVECRPMSVSNWYVLDAKGNGRTMEKMRAAIEGDARIARLHPNYLLQTQAVPNDRYWNLQWNMRMIRTPEAWNFERGSSDVTVAVIDDGVYANHPDLEARVLPGYDISEQDTNSNPEPAGQHGTHVAGIIAAQGNNVIGISGVCWNGVKILPLKIFPKSTAENLVAALEIALNGKSDITPAIQPADVVNMSIGAGVDLGDAVAQKLQECKDGGLILCAATGNDFGPILWPAVYDTVIAVGSVNPFGVASSYSNFGSQIDICAPGGQLGVSSILDPDGIVSTVLPVASPNSLYESFQGTSMACPHVAGAAALLLSAGIPPSAVSDALLHTAKPAGGPVPNRQYGWGILDVAEAVQYPASVAYVESPRNGDVLSTRVPFFHVRLPGSDPDTVQVLLDGSAIIVAGDPVSAAVEDFELNESTGELTFAYRFLDAGSHTVSVTAQSSVSSSSVASAQASFSVAPKHLDAGRYMVSFPHSSESHDPYYLLHTDLYRLARAVNEVSSSGVPSFRYAYYNVPGYANDSDASLQPGGVYAGDVNTGDSTLPRGLGYWLDVRTSMDVMADSPTDDRYPYEIDLLSGWNQIGNPYPYPISWGSAVVTYLGRTVTVSEAANRGWISPTLHRYEDGGYRSFSAPNGVMEPWEGYWLKVKVPGVSTTLTSDTDPKGVVTLTFSPGRVTSEIDTRLAAASLRTAGASASTVSAQAFGNRRPRRGGGSSAATAAEWKLTFSVQQGADRASGPSIGLVKGASEGYDFGDIESPPPPASSAWAAVWESSWGVNSGYFAADYRSVSAGAKVWYVDLFTYQAGPVTLGWRATEGPARIEGLRIVDTTTGKSINTLASSYSFDAPSGSAVRRFRVELSGGRR